MAKKLKNVPEDARPLSCGALQSPMRPPADSGLIAIELGRNMYGVSNCPKCGDTKRWPAAHTLQITCDRCGFKEQGYYRAKALWDIS